MGYKWDLERRAYLISEYYKKASLRDIAIDFRQKFCEPISPPTALRRATKDAAWVWLTTRHILLYHKNLKIGNKWEADGTYLEGVKDLCLIRVKDLTTNMTLGCFISDSEDTFSVKEALKEAKLIAKKCPSDFRCDGHRAYKKAAKTVFKTATTIHVLPRIDGKSQLQSSEADFGNFKAWLGSKRGSHSTETAAPLTFGYWVYHDFVAANTLSGVPPAETAGVFKNKSLQDMWKTLLSLSDAFKRCVVVKHANKTVLGLTENQVAKFLRMIGKSIF